MLAYAPLSVHIHVAVLIPQVAADQCERNSTRAVAVFRRNDQGDGSAGRGPGTGERGGLIHRPWRPAATVDPAAGVIRTQHDRDLAGAAPLAQKTSLNRRELRCPVVQSVL